MTDLEILQEKVEKARVKVEKCKSIIDRHRKQLEKKNELGVKWEIERKEKDIKTAENKLKDAETILHNWEEKLNIKINEKKFIENNAPQVIKDFLEDWKMNSYNWYLQRYDSYQILKRNLDEEQEIAIVGYIESNSESFERYMENGKIKEYWLDSLDDILINSRELENHLKKKRLDYGSIEAKKSSFAGITVWDMDRIRNDKERSDWLNKTLEREKQGKLVDLIYRITGTIGEIQDASKLKINKKGNLDGVVIGNKGKAKIETIGAGGYNIQEFHYRTLVNKIN